MEEGKKAGGVSEGWARGFYFGRELRWARGAVRAAAPLQVGAEPGRGRGGAAGSAGAGRRGAEEGLGDFLVVAGGCGLSLPATMPQRWDSPAGAESSGWWGGSAPGVSDRAAAGSGAAPDLEILAAGSYNVKRENTYARLAFPGASA